MPFEPKVSNAKFVFSPFTAEQMQRIGEALAEAIKTRIKRGEDVYDRPAPPLKSTGRHGGYAAYKLRTGLHALRDWTLTGRTLRSLKVLRVNENGGSVGFTDSKADNIAVALNLQNTQFGISPNDKKALEAAIEAELRLNFPIHVS